jgi:hypothetical protein
MESQEKGNSQIEFMSKKLFSMNKKLDQLAQLAHQLVVQNKGNPKISLIPKHTCKKVYLPPKDG